MPKWEYRAGKLTVEDPDDDIDRAAATERWATYCNDLGQDGWELVSFRLNWVSIGTDDEDIEPYWSGAGIFKRPVES